MTEIMVRVEMHQMAGGGAFGSLVVNGRHIWRFDTEEQAMVAAMNLATATGVDAVNVTRETVPLSFGGGGMEDYLSGMRG